MDSQKDATDNSNSSCYYPRVVIESSHPCRGQYGYLIKEPEVFLEGSRWEIQLDSGKIVFACNYDFRKIR